MNNNNNNYNKIKVKVNVKYYKKRDLITIIKNIY